MVELNLEALASIGLQFGPSFKSKALNALNANPRDRPTRSPYQKFKSINISLAGTKKLFTSEGEFLRPKVFYSSVERLDGICVGHEEHRDDDCHLNLLLQDLTNCCRNNLDEDISANGYGAFILAGVISPEHLAHLIKQENPFIICCIYQSDDDWLPWACSSEISLVMDELKRRNIIFRARKSVNLKTDLDRLLFNELFGFVGSALLIADTSDARVLSLVESFDSNFLNGLRPKSGGPCVDEFMMMHQSMQNCRNKSLTLLAQPASSQVKPVVLIGSGPSLDQSLSTLKRLEDKCILVAAGSSVGSLLRYGIMPHFHVHLERGYKGEIKALYQDFLRQYDLKDFAETVGVMPTSIDPQLPSLYRHVLMYSRMGQSPVVAWPALATASLRYEGPECLSAAFSFVLHLRPKFLFLFGCDLGAVSKHVVRSEGAVGYSPRRFNIPVSGNLTPIAYSNSRMMLQFSYMNAAYLNCFEKPNIRNASDGIRLPFAKAATFEDYAFLGLFDRDIENSCDHLFENLSNSSATVFDSPITDDVMAEGKMWIDQWIDLALRGESTSMALLRLQASRLLAERNSGRYGLIYRLFRGSLRDGFWLTAYAVDHLCKTHQDVVDCWASFSRFLQSLLLEIDALPTWLESEQ